MIEVLETEEFSLWVSELSNTHRKQVYARLLRIEEHSHFGDVKHIELNLAELRWKNGMRIYFIRNDENSILLLSGGFKNAQKKDIKKAKILLRKYAYHQN